MSKCAAIVKSTKNRCSRNVIENSGFCKQHKKIFEVENTENKDKIENKDNNESKDNKDNNESKDKIENKDNKDATNNSSILHEFRIEYFKIFNDIKEMEQKKIEENEKDRILEKYKTIFRLLETKYVNLIVDELHRYNIFRVESINPYDTLIGYRIDDTINDMIGKQKLVNVKN